MPYWHEWRYCSQSVSWQQRSGHFFLHYFLPPPFPPFSMLSTFLIEEDEKNDYLKVDWSAQKHGGKPIPDPVKHFGAAWRPF